MYGGNVLHMAVCLGFNLVHPPPPPSPIELIRYFRLMVGAHLCIDEGGAHHLFFSLAHVWRGISSGISNVWKSKTARLRSLLLCVCREREREIN